MQIVVWQQLSEQLKLLLLDKRSYTAMVRNVHGVQSKLACWCTVSVLQIITTQVMMMVLVLAVPQPYYTSQIFLHLCSVAVVFVCSIAHNLCFIWRSLYPAGPHSSRMATQERRRLLLEQYSFQCQCEACTLQQGQEEKDAAGEHNNPLESKLQCIKCKAVLKVLPLSNNECTF